MKDFKNVKSELVEKLSKCSNNANQEFAFLCEALLGIEKADILIKTDLEENEFKKLKKAVKKRLKGVPLQLIIGFSDFMGVEIIESRHTLKPRPETELMVDEIIKRESRECSLLDLCAGSGCIGLALKKAGFEEVTLSDVSSKAIKMQIKNARHNNLPVSIVRSNMLDSVVGVFDIIVSNPPYIKHSDISSLQKEVKKYDPHIALDGGADGLDFYRIIAEKSPKHLVNNGILYLEIGENQENDVVKLLQKNYKNITIIKDYNNISRIIRAEKC